MKYKYLLLIFVLTIQLDNVLACNDDTIGLVKTDSATTIMKDLIGKWTIYVWETTYYQNDSAISSSEKFCFTCLEVHFFEDKTGEVVYANGIKENIKWSIVNDSIEIANNAKIEANPLFPNHIYHIEICKKNEFVELNLLLTEKQFSIKYVLRN